MKARKAKPLSAPKESVGERIATIRGRYEMTQTELSKLLGLTKAAVSQYEADRYQPGHVIMARLAELFGSGPEWFSEGIGLPPRVPDKLVPIPEIEAQKVTRRIDDLREARGTRTWGAPSSVLSASELWADGLVVVYAPDDVTPIKRGDHCIVDTTRTELVDPGVYFVLSAEERPLLRRARSCTGLTVLGKVVGYFRMLV